MLELIQSSFDQSLFMFCPINLKFLPFTSNYHFRTDDLLYKIIVLKQAKTLFLKIPPPKKKERKKIIPDKN